MAPGGLDMDIQRVTPERLADLITVLGLIRREPLTRPQIGVRSGLGRTVVTQRLGELIQYGLVEHSDLAPSTGGRAARRLVFRSQAGTILVAQLGATSMRVGLTNLDAVVIDSTEVTCDIADGPEKIMGQVEKLFDELLSRNSSRIAPVWGIGVGVPGPVEFDTGRLVAPPIMPGWDGFSVRNRLSARYDVPVWVDNDVNNMAVGELRRGIGRGVRDFLYVKIGTGIGAGLISAGQLHRGAQGCAGDIGHVSVGHDATVLCRCGNTGCLEALAGGAALARDAQAIAQSSPTYLGRVLASGESIDARAVALAAEHGDPDALELFVRSGRLIGETLSQMVNFFNPSLIVLGGGVASSGDHFLAAIRQSVYQRSLALATRDLVITRSPLELTAGLVGCAFMVLDELFSPKVLAHWLQDSPVGRPGLAGLGT